LKTRICPHSGIDRGKRPRGSFKLSKSRSARPHSASPDRQSQSLHDPIGSSASGSFRIGRFDKNIHDAGGSGAGREDGQGGWAWASSRVFRRAVSVSGECALSVNTTAVYYVVAQPNPLGLRASEFYEIGDRRDARACSRHRAASACSGDRRSIFPSFTIWDTGAQDYRIARVLRQAGGRQFGALSSQPPRATFTAN